MWSKPEMFTNKKRYRNNNKRFQISMQFIYKGQNKRQFAQIRGAIYNSRNQAIHNFLKNCNFFFPKFAEIYLFKNSHCFMFIGMKIIPYEIKGHLKKLQL